jgi:DNA repair exonuclease SbcCD ATPase subunit
MTKINEPIVKSTKKKTDETTPVIITVETFEDSSLNQLNDYLLTTDQVIDQAKNSMIMDSIGSDEKLNQFIESYSSLIISGIEDMTTYKVVNAAISEVKKMRTNLEKKRKELTAPALRFQKALIDVENIYSPKLKELEEKLKAEKTRIDDAKEAAKKVLYNERVNKLVAAGYELASGFFICGALQVPTTEVTEYSNDEIEFYVLEGTKELERKKAEQLRKDEQERFLKEQREALEAEKLELATMKAEMLQMKADMLKERQEIQAQKTALETTYETAIEQPHEPVMNPNPIEGNGMIVMEGTPPPASIQMAEQSKPIIQSTSEKIAALNKNEPIIQPVIIPADVPIVVSEEFKRGFDYCKIEVCNILKTRADLKSRAEFIEAINLL